MTDAAAASTSRSAPLTPSHSTERLATATAPRLLYRGALCLPDSQLLLDGLSFVAESAHLAAKSPSKSLLENPLALALESMRGRNLYLLGTEKMSDVWLDARNDITVYIHHYSALSKMYFENVLCNDPITSPMKRTDLGIRVGLTDDDDDSQADLLIYGQLVPVSEPVEEGLPSSSQSPPYVLQLFASRILPGPPPPITRLPRPDDPTPRKPQAYLSTGAKRKRDSSQSLLDTDSSNKRGRASSNAATEDNAVIQRAREVMLNLPKPGLSKAASQKISRQGSKAAGDFKIPQLPARASSTDIIASEDVFGPVNGSGAKNKGKDAEKAGSSELEKANKTVIKQATIACLSKHGITKAHAEFNDLYQFTYRGVSFAMRNIMRTQALAMRTVDRLVQEHVRMYLKGTGENHPK